MSMFKQKLSFRTQLALAELIAEVKTEAGKDDETAKWNGEFVLWYDDRVRYPRLAVYMDHSVPGSGFGQWWTKVEDRLVADESLDFLMRG
jgi:hypothetical protein